MSTVKVRFTKDTAWKGTLIKAGTEVDLPEHHAEAAVHQKIATLSVGIEPKPKK